MSGGIKGYPSSQKLVKGQPPTITEFATIQPTDAGLRGALDVLRFAFRVGSDTVPRTAQAGTGNPTDGFATVVFDTATPARVGDFVRFETGAAARLEIPIVAVATNSFTLAAKIPTALAPAATNTFFIMRYATQRVDENGSQVVTVTQGPIQFVLDGNDTEVSEDTGTPADSVPLPVKIMDGSGVPVNFSTEPKQDDQIVLATAANAMLTDIETNTASTVTELIDLNTVDFATQTTLAAMNAKFNSLGQKAMAGSAPVVLASDQTALPLSTNAATETTLAAMSAKLPSTLGQKVMAASLAVVLPSDQTINISGAGYSYVDSSVKNSGNVSSGSWVELIASTSGAAKGLEVFDSSGFSLELGVGGSGSESRILLIPPGGLNGFVPLAIPAGSRISIRAISSTADYSAAENLMTLLG